MTRHEVHVV